MTVILHAVEESALTISAGVSGNSASAAWLKCLSGPALAHANTGSFDSVRTSLRKVLTPLRVTHFQGTLRFAKYSPSKLKPLRPRQIQLLTVRTGHPAAESTAWITLPNMCEASSA